MNDIEGKAASRTKQKTGELKSEISAFQVSTFKLLTVLISTLCFPNFNFQPFPLVLLIIVVITAISSSASFSIGRVSAEAMPQSSLSNSSHI